MNQHTASRLNRLSVGIIEQAGELAAMLSLPREEMERGELDLLDVGEYINVTNTAMSTLAFWIVQTQGVIERLERGEEIVEYGAGVPQYPGSLRAPLNRRLAGYSPSS